jgi:hypothetical protein
VGWVKVVHRESIAAEARTVKRRSALGIRVPDRKRRRQTVKPQNGFGRTERLLLVGHVER